MSAADSGPPPVAENAKDAPADLSLSLGPLHGTTNLLATLGRSSHSQHINNAAQDGIKGPLRGAEESRQENSSQAANNADVRLSPVSTLQQDGGRRVVSDVLLRQSLFLHEQRPTLGLMRVHSVDPANAHAQLEAILGSNSIKGGNMARVLDSNEALGRAEALREESTLSAKTQQESPAGKREDMVGDDGGRDAKRLRSSVAEETKAEARRWLLDSTTDLNEARAAADQEPTLPDWLKATISRPGSGATAEANQQLQKVGGKEAGGSSVSALFQSSGQPAEAMAAAAAAAAGVNATATSSHSVRRSMNPPTAGNTAVSSMSQIIQLLEGSKATGSPLPPQQLNRIALYLSGGGAGVEALSSHLQQPQTILSALSQAGVQRQPTVTPAAVAAGTAGARASPSATPPAASGAVANIASRNLATRGAVSTVADGAQASSQAAMATLWAAVLSSQQQQQQRQQQQQQSTDQVGVSSVELLQALNGSGMLRCMVVVSFSVPCADSACDSD